MLFCPADKLHQQVKVALVYVNEPGCRNTTVLISQLCNAVDHVRIESLTTPEFSHLTQKRFKQGSVTQIRKKKVLDFNRSWYNLL